jgi:hypothetical protein
MQTLTLKLTPEQLSVISDGLLLTPFGKAAPVVSEINKQIAQQIEKPDLNEQEKAERAISFNK